MTTQLPDQPTIQPSDHLPIEVVFNLLCACRQGRAATARELRLTLQQRGLVFGDYHDLPKLSFWIRLCQAASLLDEQNPPCPTLFAEDWLGYPLWEQLIALLEAWYQTPQAPDLQQLRMHLPGWLLEGIEFGPKAQHELSGLKALNIVSGNGLTAIGRWIVAARNDPPTHELPAAWSVESTQQGNEYCLVVPFPPDWRLLWQIEAYLSPITPGVYILNAETLRSAVQRGALHGGEIPSLLNILEQGLEMSLPDDWRQAMAGAPIVRVLPGPVLEFSEPQEMENLRQSRSWRRELETLLSPRHVHLDPWRAPAILHRLERKGLLSPQDIERIPYLTTRLSDHPSNQPSDHLTNRSSDQLTKAERAFCLSLLLLAEGLKAPFTAPPGFFRKLIGGMDDRLRASAARKASQAIEQITPLPQWIPEEEAPEMPETELVEILQKAIQLEQPIDIFYHASGRSMPEYRHITPLLLEQRGPRYYLMAYCHNRRANRTFRLDRMKLLDFPPTP